MPTRKVFEPKAAERCQHPDHTAPGMMVYEPGLYEHKCPACGRTYQFRVYGVTC